MNCHQAEGIFSEHRTYLYFKNTEETHMFIKQTTYYFTERENIFSRTQTKTIFNLRTLDKHAHNFPRTSSTKSYLNTNRLPQEPHYIHMIISSKSGMLITYYTVKYA